MNAPDPIPRDFGWRYIAWLAWSNAITVLAVAQGAIASVMLMQDDSPNALLSHNAYRYVVLANAILTGIIAQVKKNSPPGPPPTKVSSP